MIYKLVFLLVSLFVTFNSQVFLEQPGYHVLAPIETQVQLRCSVVEGYRIEWGVTLPDPSLLYITDVPGVLEILKARGITVESSDNDASLLVINATESTNGTVATCIAINRNDPLAREESREVQVLFYGSPSTPINLTAAENGVGSLRISWSSSFSIEGELHFVLISIINSSSVRPVLVTGTQEQFIFTVEDSSSCDVYSFQVTALNAAGSSGPSEILIRSLPSLPDISAVEDSLEQSLVKTADGVTLSVMFQGITSCPEYPVTSYTLVLVDSEGNETRESSADTSGEITLVIDRLMEDSLYSYYIMAANMIGNSVSDSVYSLVTSDVLGVSFCTHDDTINIQCSYIIGSEARGCVYTLVSGVEGEANITGTIDRRSSEGVQKALPNIGDFVELLVFDWERDNSTGIVPVRGTHLNNMTCILSTPEGTTDLSASTLGSSDNGESLSVLTIVIVIAAILLFLILVSLFLCVIIICCMMKSKDSVTSRICSDTDVYDTVKSVISPSSDMFRNQEMVNVTANPSYSVVVKSGADFHEMEKEYEEIGL